MVQETLQLALCLYPGVTALDYQGPVEQFGFISPQNISRRKISESCPYLIDITYFSHTLDPVEPSSGPMVLPMRKYGDVRSDEQFDIIFIPGGPGARAGKVPDEVLTFVKQQAPKAKYVLTVCTGSWILAGCGVLEGKRATTNKAAFAAVKADTSEEIQWVGKARWVVDGNIWTSSGVTAGIDMANAFLTHLIGEETTAYIRNIIELSIREHDDDEFAVVHNSFEDLNESKSRDNMLSRNQPSTSMEVETTEGNASRALSIKRKADEAFDALDEALRTRDSRPSPSKKTTNVSFYSSLAKHGITSKPTVRPSVSTPTLSALLTRARSKKDIIRPPLHFQSPKMPSVAPEYSPGSTNAFLERLSTFNVSTYPSKPQSIDAVAAAMAGWINEGGRNRLLCSMCHIGWIVGGRDGLGKEAADTLVEKQANNLVTNHKEGCPWRTRQCDPLVYRIPLQSSAKMAKQVKEHADELDPLMEGVTVRHPLSIAQLNSFVQTITAVVSKPAAGDSDSDPEKACNEPAVKVPSATSLLTALFGWTLVPLPPPIDRKPSAVSLARIRNQSLSRANSVVQSAPPSRDVTPAPQAPMSTPPATPSHSRVPDFTSSPQTPSGLKMPTAKDATLQCKMCQRRIGLWAFAAATSDSPDSPFTPNGTGLPQRQLDLVREHRSYCPYVVKSTPLATLPLYGVTASSQPQPVKLARTGTSLSETAPSDNLQKPTLFRSASIFPLGRNISPHGHGRSQSIPPALQDLPLVEGWRAVYNTILRYGISERATATAGMIHVGRSRGSPPRLQPQLATLENNGDEDDDDAMSGVNKIVEDVKRHGGKRILAYVKNLLG